MMTKGFACALLGSALFAVAIQFAPTAPPKGTLGTRSVNSWVYDPVTKETRVMLTGMVAQGYVPAKKFEDPEQAEDVANVELDAETSRKVLARGK